MLLDSKDRDRDMSGCRDLVRQAAATRPRAR